MTKLDERLYWLLLNDQGLYETGFLLTEEQLLQELPVMSLDALSSPRRLKKEELSEMFEEYSDGTKGFEGAYYANKTFFVQKVKDIAELRDLLTWRQYDPCEGYTAAMMDKEYPGSVPDILRLSACVHGDEPGTTSIYLPSGEENPTVAKYAKVLGLSSGELSRSYTNVEKAAMEISREHYNGKLTEQSMKQICDMYHVCLQP